jgi:multidrug efflux pump subunit AcrA (membrane-fusion protein)
VHVVTKILLVFCAVLSLLLAALTMAYAANAGSIREAYKALELEKLAAQAARNDLQTQWDRRETEVREKVEAANRDKQQFKTENDALQAQRTEIRTQLEQAKAAAQAAENRFVELGSTVKTQADVIKVYSEEVTKLRDDMVKSARRENELLDRINDLEAQREVLEQSARALQEQLKEAQLALTSAQGGGGPRTGDQPFEHIGPPIYARVTSTTRAPDGSELVTISEGSNRNIKTNMILNITRGSNFIAKLIVTNVDPNAAVGRVDKLGRDVTVQDGDQVVSTLQK